MADKYRFVKHISPEHRMDRLEVAEGKVLEYDPDRVKEPVALTDKQYQELLPYAVLEKVEPDPPSPDEAVAGMDYRALQGYAKDNDLPDRGGKNEEELRTLVRDHLATQTKQEEV